MPFDVEVERLPSWVYVSSAIVIIIGVLVTFHLVPMLAFLPFLIASSIGRRFLHTQAHAEIHPNAFLLGKYTMPRDRIVDVWLDSDDVDARVTVHWLDEDAKRDGDPSPRMHLSILYFENRDQAIRFAEALAPAAKTDEHVCVGYAPRSIDLLAGLRFAAVGAAFVQTGGWLSLVVFAFAVLGASSYFRAKQISASTSTDRFTIRTAIGATSYAYSDVASIVIDTGTIALKSGGTITIGRGSIRDTMLGSPAWLERSRRRVLKQIRDARDARKDEGVKKDEGHES